MTICGSTPSTASLAEEMCMYSSPTSLRKSLHALSISAMTGPESDGAGIVIPEIGVPGDVCVPIASKKLRDSSDFQGMRLVRSSALGTQARAREYFARIREPLRIEGAAHELHGLQVGLGKHFGHHRSEVRR